MILQRPGLTRFAAASKVMLSCNHNHRLLPHATTPQSARPLHWRVLGEALLSGWTQPSRCDPRKTQVSFGAGVATAAGSAANVPTTATASRPALGIVDLRDRFTSHKCGQAPPRQWGLCLRDPFRCPLIASTYVSFTSTGGRRIADASVVDLIVPPNPSTFVHLAGRVRRHARTPPNELARLRPLHTDEPVAFDNDSECAIAVLAPDAKTSPPNQDVCRRSWQAHAASAHRATSLVANATSLRHSPLASC